jgi:molecular chaperone DnaJ
MAKDYYKILGLTKGATADEIKRAYRRLAHEHHPDKGGNQEKFKEINEAYQVLGDAQKRTQYDRYGSDFEQAQARGGGFSGFNGFRDFSSFGEAFSGAGNEQAFNFEDIFEGVFGGSRRGAKKPRRGQNISVDVEISLEDAYKGIEKEISLHRNVVCQDCGGTGAEKGSKMKECKTCQGQGQVEQRSGGGFFTFSQVVTCPDCLGAGKKPEKKCSSCGGDGRKKESSRISIKIPAGISDGQVISLSGQGEAGLAGVPAGDLYVNVHVRPDPRFTREGDNLFYELPITFSQAALGDKIEIPTLSGWISLKIPEGVESGTIIRLEDKGMPRLQHRGFGDMMVKVRIKTPKRLSRKAKELLEELKREIE